MNIYKSNNKLSINIKSDLINNIKINNLNKQE